MTLFLRTKENKDIFTVDIWTELEHYDNNKVKRRYTEMSTYINIGNYSNLLIKFATQYLDDIFNKKDETVHIDDFIYNMHHLSELRSWMWEDFFGSKDNVGNKDVERKIIESVEEKMNKVANKFDLVVVQD